MLKRYLIGTLVWVWILAVVPPPLSADIYMYTDENGVIHFSNTPTSDRYRLYMREGKRQVRRAGSTRRYDDLIRRASDRHDLDFSLVKAVIKVESNFDSRAVSRKGAKGLMQIMPQNYRSLKISDPFDPAENIMGGSLYLRRMLNRFDGKLEMALAAYNAGPGAVEEVRGIPPYRETRNYVKKVMKYYRMYKK